jgi:hypothetical protein
MSATEVHGTSRDAARFVDQMIHKEKEKEKE